MKNSLPVSCISSVSYIKPQLQFYNYLTVASCISSVSYIKPQHTGSTATQPEVVYRPFPTSNHNAHTPFVNLKELYIVRFLHQTTTCSVNTSIYFCCISSVSYIKPQQTRRVVLFWQVVYRPFPTSNHNILVNIRSYRMLYIVRFLHQTTT